MLNQLQEFLRSFAGWFKVITIVNEYERAVVLRLGKYQKTAEPGAHWHLPFGITEFWPVDIRYSTRNLSCQTLTTVDDKTVLVSIVLRYRVRDPKKFELEVEDADTVLQDGAYGELGKLVRASTWEEMWDETFVKQLREQIRRRAGRWGVEVTDVEFTDLSLSRTYRILNE